jgi:hypothetical protein
MIDLMAPFISTAFSAFAGSAPPVLTRRRVWLAYGAAVATDLLQLALGPFGWVFADQALDLAAMAFLWRVVGFHPLLLPTFVLEFLPVADVLPTWTGCVALVIAMRRRQRTHAGPDPGPYIDV